MKRDTPFAFGEFYHLYNRGTDKRTIFKDKNDHDRFVLLLYLCNSSDSVSIANEIKKHSFFEDLFLIERPETLVEIGAYCLMPNHFHLLVYEKKEGGISAFMKKLLTGYSMFFNTKYERTGGLFEGRFKSTHVNSDTYLKYLFAYIHLNPVKLIDPQWKENGIRDRTGAKKYLDSYLYSSYRDYVEGTQRSRSAILHKQSFPEYFADTASFKTYINDWLTYRDPI